MKEWFSAIESIGAKIGIPAALFAGWLYLQVTDLQDTVARLEEKTETINEIKQDIASIKTSLDLIIKVNFKEKQ